MKKSFLVLCALLATAGCKSSSAGNNAPLGTVADIRCDQILACDDGQVNYDRASVTSSADCNAQMEAMLRSDFNYQAYLDDGSVRVDRGALSDCLAALDANPCVPRGDIPACGQIYVGTLSTGTGCSRDIQCLSGACTAVSADQCGVCLAPAAIGEACDLANDNCMPSPDGFVDCVATASGAVCVLDTANYLTVGLNEVCNNNGGIDRHCASPYYCDTNEVCAERIAVGMPCDPSFDDCVFGATCGNTPAGDVCLAVVNVTVAGQPCGVIQPSGEFARCDRSARLYCDNNTDTCATLAGTGTENSDCFVASDCDSGLICVIGDFVDQPGSCETTNKVLGTRCDSDAECASHLCRQDPTSLQDVCTAVPTCP